MPEAVMEAMQFVICIRNDGYAVSLELRKLYRTLPDPVAMKHGQVRVVDESGEDYLYPENYFIAVDLPGAVKEALSNAA